MPRLTWHTLTLHLRNPFRLSYGVSESRLAFWLRLENDEGWGEGTIPPYYRVDPSAMTACWQAAADKTEPFPETIEDIPAWIPDGPAPSRSAIELALFDRLARRAGQPLYQFLKLPKPPHMPTSFTIAIDTPDAMARMAAEKADYGIIKLKLGSEDDESRVKAVREARPDARLLVDANGGWSLAQAIAHLHWLERYDLEVIEQPVPREQIAQMGEVQRHTGIPIVADESVQSVDDVRRLAAAGVAGVNLKLMKLGGLTPALEVLRVARELNLKVMLGCMMETAIGTTAMAHLAGLADWLDLDAPLLITDDPFDGLAYDSRARITVPDRAGIGAVRKSQQEIA